MKKKNILIIILAVLTALSVTALSGCGVNSLGSIEMKTAQDTAYAVHSNGGNIVQYGNYIYFVNGYAGYEDTEGTANEWKKVVKGGLYRAELLGEKGEKYKATDKYEFDIKGKLSEISDEFMEFDYSEGKDYDDNKTDVVNVQLVAPKVIGTSGYKSGGIYIYDNYVYYASPNNERNKAGTVQFKKTDFFRTSLDGKVTQRLFTTEADSVDSPYAFYKQNGKTYLVVLDGTTLKSVVMSDVKVEDTLKIAEDVSSAYLPTRSDYYGEGKQLLAAEDFVYISRAATEKDSPSSGTVLEFMAPDGSDRTIFLSNGKTSSIEAVRDGVVFYRTEINSNTEIKFDNLHNLFMQNSDRYKESENADAKRTEVSGTALAVNNLSDFTFTYPFRPSADRDVNTNMTYVLASTGSKAYLYGSDGSQKLVYDGSATINAVIGAYAYFTDSETKIARFRIDIENISPEVVSDRAVTMSGLSVDTAAGYIMYFGKVDDWASDYSLFKKLPGEGKEGAKAVFVGQRSEKDVKPEEDE